MTSFLQNLRLALRSLGRAPALTGLVIVTLALGIGATTSVYSVARAALFAGPPFPDADRLALVWEQEGDGTESNVGYATYEDLAREPVFASSAAMGYWSPTISDGNETTRLIGQRVTWRFFDVLGVRPMLGRGFVAEEDKPGATQVVVLGHQLWASRFGSDSALVGRDIQVNGLSYRVAGVLPPEFESLMAPTAQIWRPLGYDASVAQACRTCRHLRMVGRLRPDLSLGAADGALDATYSRLASTWRDVYAADGVRLTPLHEYVVRDSRRALIALLAAVGIVALIACFNAANLLLGRALKRESEFAVRVALGASASRLAAILLSEGLLIAVGAAVLGTILTFAGVALVLQLAPAGIPRLDQVRIDGTVLLFAATMAALTGILASALPAFALLRSGISRGIRVGSRALVGVGRHRLRALLVAGEVALAVMLVSGASLLLGSVSRLLAVDGGFETRDRFTMQLALSGPSFADSGSVFQAWSGALAAIQAVPGVQSIALASQVPLGGNFDMYGLHLEGDGTPADDPYAQRYAVTPGYFETMGISLLRGRSFTNADAVNAPGVILINEFAARSLYPDGNAVGRRINVGSQLRTIVGVVSNTLHETLDTPQSMQVYIPWVQWGEEGGMTLVLHSSTGENTIPAVTRAIRQAISGVSISNVASYTRLVDLSTANRQFALALFAGFAAVALILAAAGLFGVLSATVVERTREIGVRTALGAPRGRILGMVVRQGALLTGTGLLVGLVATWGSTQVIATLLYGVGASDPTVLAVVIASLMVVALIASALPAWRASRVDPVIALRDG
jgi:putative ABC transport system permease protein